MKKDFIVILFGKILQILLMLITVRLTTSLLDAKEIGSLYIFMTFASFFMLIFLHPVGQYIQRHLNEWKEKKILFQSFTYFILYVLIIATVSSLAISIYIFFMGMPLAFTYFDFISLLFFYIIFLYLNPFFLAMLNLLYYRITFVFLTLMTSLFLLIFGYFFISYFGSFTQYWLRGILLSNIIFMMISYFYLKKNLDASFSFKRIIVSKNNIKNIYKFTIPLAIATLFMWLQNNGYRIIIEKNIGLEFLGLMAVGMAVATQISTVFESIVMQYFHPIYYKEITNTTLENRRKAINNFINKVLPIYLLLAFFLTFMAEYLLRLLVDEKFFKAYIFTIFGVWIEFFRITTNLLGNISQSEMNTKSFMKPYIIGSCVTIICIYFSSLDENYFLMLPLSLILGGFVTFLGMYFYMKRLISFNIDYSVLIFATLLSLPYLTILLFEFEKTFLINLIVVLVYGSYFLGMVYILYKRGLKW